MLPALMLLAALADWVPARWHSNDPQSLDLLSGSPVNCLLVEKPFCGPEFTRKAAQQNLAVLVVLHTGDSLPSGDFNAIVLEGDFEPHAVSRLRAEAKVPVIELPSRRGIRLDTTDPICGTSQALWPGIEIEHGGSTLTGPTASPWIDTNTGFLSFFRAATGAAIWVGARPPSGKIFPAERYLQAVGDAAIAGARWIVSLDNDLERRLLAREPAAIRVWNRIGAYLRYFEEHTPWRSYRPYSRLALVEDRDNGALLSAGLVDMLGFQHSPVRVIPRRRVSAESLAGVRVVLNVDAAPVDSAERQALDAFARSGGTVLAPPAGWKFPPIPEGQITPTRRQLEQMGPMWEVAYHATARKNFGVRLFNVASTVAALLADPDERSLLIHLLNFTDFAGEAITLHALGGWKHARLYSPEAPVKNLEVYSIPEGTGIDLERVPVFATVRLDQ